MKKIICVAMTVLMVFFMTCNIFCANTMEKQNFSASVQSFLSEHVQGDSSLIITKQKMVNISNAITTYVAEEDKIEKSAISYHIISSDDKPFGVLGAICQEGVYSFEYFEPDFRQLSKDLTDDVRIAIVFDDYSFNVVSDSIYTGHNDAKQYEIREYTYFEKSYITINFSVPTNLAQVRSGYSINNFPTVLQTQNCYCWAACAAAFGNYYTGVSLTDYQVAAAYGLTNSGLLVTDITSVIATVFNMNSMYWNNSLSISDIKNSVLNDDPLICGINSPNASVAHMMVIKGYAEGSSYTSLIFMDPLYGTRVISLSSTTAPISFIYYGVLYTTMGYVTV